MRECMKNPSTHIFQSFINLTSHIPLNTSGINVQFYQFLVVYFHLVLPYNFRLFMSTIFYNYTI